MISLFILVVLLVFLLLMVWFERVLSEAVNNAVEDFREFDEHPTPLSGEGRIFADSSIGDNIVCNSKDNSLSEPPVKIPVRYKPVYPKARGEVSPPPVAH